MSEWAKNVFLDIVSDSIPSLLVGMDSVGTILLANSSAENLFNYSKGELVGKSIEVIIPNGFKNCEIQTCDKFGVQPQFLIPDSGCDVFGRRKDGSEFRVEILVSPKSTGKGLVVLATIVAIEKSNYFHFAQSEIKSREDLISIVSHELRTPLTSLVMQLQLLGKLAKREFQEGQSSGTISELATQAEKEVLRFLRLIENLLDTSRIKAGQLRLNKERVDLIQLVQEVIAHSQREIETSHCSIQLIHNGKVVGLWDRSRIEQVVNNLLGNALKYGAGKPIEILISQDHLKSTLVVRDHGIGVSKEDQPRLFNQFERLNADKQFSGFGLGLYIVRQIIEAHGGGIHLESEPGEFTTFRVELPLKVMA